MRLHQPTATAGTVPIVGVQLVAAQQAQLHSYELHTRENQRTASTGVAGTRHLLATGGYIATINILSWTAWTAQIHCIDY